MVFSAFLASVMQVDVPVVVFIEVGLAIWVVYTWDHLSDAKTAKEVSSFRHQFHHQHQQALLIGLIGALITGAALVYFLPIQTIYLGISIAVLVLIYFAIIHFYKKFYHKETLVAIVYTLGVFLGPYSCAERIATSSLIACFANVVLLAFVNLMIFSEFEKEADQKAGYPSLALALGHNARPLIAGVLVFQLLTLIMLFSLEVISDQVAFCFILMNLMLCLIFFGQSLSQRNEYYRVIGDGIFFIPVIFLL